MSRLRILVMAVLACSTLATFTVPAYASVPAAPSAKFCTAASKIGNGKSSGDTQSLQQLKGSVKQIKAAAKVAPAKVRAAGNTVASVLSKISSIDPTNAGDLARFYTTSDYKKYGKAVVKFFTYAATCVGG